METTKNNQLGIISKNTILKAIHNKVLNDNQKEQVGNYK